MKPLLVFVSRDSSSGQHIRFLCSVVLSERIIVRIMRPRWLSIDGGGVTIVLMLFKYSDWGGGPTAEKVYA
jgi:hypothetical protein